MQLVLLLGHFQSLQNFLSWCRLCCILRSIFRCFLEFNSCTRASLGGFAGSYRLCEVYGHSSQRSRELRGVVSQQSLIAFALRSVHEPRQHLYCDKLKLQSLTGQLWKLWKLGAKVWKLQRRVALVEHVQSLIHPERSGLSGFESVCFVAIFSLFDNRQYLQCGASVENAHEALKCRKLLKLSTSFDHHMLNGDTAGLCAWCDHEP